MATIDWIFAGKGGVGKSFIAWLIAQHRLRLGKTDVLDTDPLNDTLNQFKDLNPEHIQIMNKGVIDKRLFDNLVIKILESNAQNVVIDTGSSNYIDLVNYIQDNDILSLLVSEGHKVNVHIAVTGGVAMHDTLLGFNEMMKIFDIDCVNFVLWENEYFGELERNKQTFQEMTVYKTHKDRINGNHIVIDALDEDTTKVDLKNLLMKRMTFEQGIISDDFNLLETRRLKRMQDSYFDALAEI